MNREQHAHPKVVLSADDFVYRTKMCNHGDACTHKECGFAHSQDELRRIPCRFQSLCTKWKTTCRRTHLFVDGHDAVFCPPVKENTSLAMRTLRQFQGIEEGLLALECRISTLEEELDVAIAESVVIAEQKDALLNELEVLRSEIEEEIDDGWPTLRKTTRMVDWGASDSEEDDNETTPAPPTKPASWAALFIGRPT